MRSYGLLLLDVALLGLSLMGAFMLRFDGSIPRHFVLTMAPVWLAMLPVRIAVLHAFGLYRYMWRYSGLHEMLRLVAGVGLSSLAVALVLGVTVSGPFPRSIPVLEWMLATALIGASRLAARLVEGVHRPRPQSRPVRRVLIAGAGSAGTQIAREIGRHQELGLEPVGFLDDDPQKLGGTVSGVRVLGTIDAIPRLVRDHRVDEILIAIPSAPRRVIRTIYQRARDLGVDARTLPGRVEVLDGRVSVGQFRDVSIDDLLGRAQVAIRLDELREGIGGNTVVVTGAGGSIGSELCRQLAHLRPSRLILTDIAENSLFEIDRQIRSRHPSLDVRPVMMDVRYRSQLRQVFERHRPDLVFHVAALKHVTLMEANPRQAVVTNVFGTRNVALEAARSGAERFVLVSTDKAVYPSSIMGATKRLAELVVQSMPGTGATRLITVRFGNVLGSSGSVVPIFQRQIAEGGPVTVTDPHMTRYFMTIAEAVHLVIHAGVMGEGGELFVLDMGEPVRIMDLAHELIELSGLSVGRDLDIEVVGARRGEKLHESLTYDHEVRLSTPHPRILRVESAEQPDEGTLAPVLHLLRRMSADPAPSPGDIRDVLFRACAPARAGAGSAGQTVAPDGAGGA